jgi:hypothetical protein
MGGEAANAVAASAVVASAVTGIVIGLGIDTPLESQC